MGCRSALSSRSRLTWREMGVEELTDDRGSWGVGWLAKPFPSGGLPSPVGLSPPILCQLAHASKVEPVTQLTFSWPEQCTHFENQPASKRSIAARRSVSMATGRSILRAAIPCRVAILTCSRWGRISSSRSISGSSLKSFQRCSGINLIGTRCARAPSRWVEHSSPADPNRGRAERVPLPRHDPDERRQRQRGLGLAPRGLTEERSHPGRRDHRASATGSRGRLISAPASMGGAIDSQTNRKPPIPRISGSSRRRSAAPSRPPTAAPLSAACEIRLRVATVAARETPIFHPSFGSCGSPRFE